MKNSSILVGGTILGMLVILSIIGWLTFKPEPVVIQGEAEARTINVAPKITGRMESMRIKEGDKVKKGDTLLLLNSPEIAAKLAQAKAAKSAAEAQNQKATKGAREEQIQAAKNVWQKAKVAAELTEKTFERVENLHRDGVLPEQKRDEAETQMKAAQLTAEAAKANYEMAQTGTRREDKRSAQALVEQAEGAISEVEAFLSENNIVAPISAEVEQINAHIGELVTAGFPVVTLIDLDDVWFTFNIREDFLSDFAMNKEFKVTIPALGNQTIMVKTTYISPRGNYATWRATKASGDFDKKMFEVRATPIKKPENLRPGMSALIKQDNTNS
jgi:HlyD family secretion protein